ncbi:hypothetical protein PoMZ_05761 [Pyricularia oryzae]|uniref:Uncharacterized protein n=1 Tax=Pyricularia oryzae TaxID=318829 RepID=A0A4P7NPD5_PYROR|nr:hypothetical protein PoMZ_05761 [Pyricularia oryzae]
MQNFHDDEQKAAPCIKCFEFKLFKSEDLWRTAIKSKGPVLSGVFMCYKLKACHSKPGKPCPRVCGLPQADKPAIQRLRATA